MSQSSHNLVVETPISRRLLVDPQGVRPSSLPRNVHLARSLNDHSGLEDPRCNLVLFFWQPMRRLVHLLEGTPQEQLPEALEGFAGDAIDPWVNGAATELQALLYSELAPYVREFQKLTRAKQLSSRLQRCHEQMCPLFHVDHMPLRMIVTLKGSGTEWLDEADVRRQGLGKGRNDKIVREGALVQQLQPFQIGFMKGQLYRSHYGRGLVHRSPEANGPGQNRYLFKLDATAMA
jgi:hypothetical protein